MRLRIFDGVNIDCSGRPSWTGGVDVVKARPAAGGGRWVEISPERLSGWLDGFYGRHDGATEQGLVLTGASNGDSATLYPPPGLDNATDVDTLLAGLVQPPRIALLLARRGAAGAAIVDGTTVTASKVERFYVQGRTAAGGSSQQRYARRRANQADAATERAADVAARVLLPHTPGVGAGSDGSINALVCGGDRSMIDAVLADPAAPPAGAPTPSTPARIRRASAGGPTGRGGRCPADPDAPGALTATRFSCLKIGTSCRNLPSHHTSGHDADFQPVSAHVGYAVGVNHSVDLNHPGGRQLCAETLR